MSETKPKKRRDNSSTKKTNKKKKKTSDDDDDHYKLDRIQTTKQDGEEETTSMDKKARHESTLGNESRLETTLAPSNITTVVDLKEKEEGERNKHNKKKKKSKKRKDSTDIQDPHSQPSKRPRTSAVDGGENQQHTKVSEKKKNKKKEKKNKKKDDASKVTMTTTIQTETTTTTEITMTTKTTTTKKETLTTTSEKDESKQRATDATNTMPKDNSSPEFTAPQGRPIVESSAFLDPQTLEKNGSSSFSKATSSEPSMSSSKNNPSASSSSSVTLLLFYQYVEPPWTNEEYKQALAEVEAMGNRSKLTGRMRVAREGLNCTLTGSGEGIMNFCRALRRWKPNPFLGTEFKLTHHVPVAQTFAAPLKIIPVQELVHYGLEGAKAPPIHLYHGTHLEPQDYHAKMAESNAVVIDVRNHYEATIGRFVPPTGAAEWIDPKMRKSTEFPVWLDKPETLSKLQDKQVLMYCTGGIRCERASALLKYKMEHDPTVKNLNIKGVYQLQGGIDKYFKEFPEGGFWKGKNYTFDRRCAHAPVVHEHQQQTQNDNDTQETCNNGLDQPRPPPDNASVVVMGKCEGCGKAWDKYRGKRRCPTCGVPSLTCRDCWLADQEGKKKLDRSIRCDLCVEQGIWSKHDLRQREAQELEEYENKMKQLHILHPASVPTTGTGRGEEAGEAETSTKETTTSPQIGTHGVGESESFLSVANPDGVTRVYLRNMCRKNMTEQVLMKHLAGITHIVWKLVYNRSKGGGGANGVFLGQGWVEFATPDAAARAVAQSGQLEILRRPLFMTFQPPNAKDCWPPPHSAVHYT